MHKTLKRQMHRVGIDPENLSDDLRVFCETISRTYASFDDDHALIERTLELNSKELNAKNEQLEKNLRDRERYLRSVTQREQEMHQLISGLERAQHQSEQQRQYFESIIAHLPDGVITMDTAKTIVFVNATATTLFGADIQNLHGTLYDDLAQEFKTPRTPYAKDEQSTDIVLRTQRLFTREQTLFRRVDKHFFPASIYVLPLLTDGILTGAMSIIRPYVQPV